MEYVAPGDVLASRLALGPASTGLTGTVRFRLLDSDVAVNDPVIGPVAAGIVEDPTGSGSYLYIGVCPSTEGKYSPAWDKGVGTPLIFDEDIVVTRSAALPFTPSGDEYVTRDEMKALLKIVGKDYLDDELDLAVETASRVIDGYKGTSFFPTTEARYFDAARYEDTISIPDLASLTSLKVDTDGNGTYDETWVNGTDFKLYPLNGLPKRRVVLLRQAARSYPPYQANVEIIGAWGWNTTPPQVRSAARILASRYVKRAPESPYAFVTMMSEAVQGAAYLPRTDPDVAGMLDSIPGPGKRLFV